MIKRYLEHFTQDEVDKAPGEILTKDLPYGGNRPYVIGTLLRDSTSGEYLLWRKGTEAHRLCIEHAPNELVEWTIATENMSSATLVLQQLTKDHPFGRIKRIGMIPLNAATDFTPGTYYDKANCVSIKTLSPDQNDPSHWFSMPPEKAELKLNQVSPSTKPTYCELDALLFKPFLTDEVWFTNLHFAISARGVVFYCVYELDDGLVRFPSTDVYYNAQGTVYSYPLYFVPFMSGILKYFCVDVKFEGGSTTYYIAIELYKQYYVPGEDLKTVNLVSFTQTTADRRCFIFGPANFSFQYGSNVYIKAVHPVENRRALGAYLRFTSDRFNS